MNSCPDRKREALELMRRQSVKRKGGKYVYIICSKNPKHKQRYGFLHADL